MVLAARALPGIPEVGAGDDLGALLAAALERAEIALESGDAVAVSHKVVSKAEGQVRRLAEVEPSRRARRLGRRHGKDPRLVQVILDESAQLLRARDGVLVCVTHAGFVCANAGVDTSNLPEAGLVALLPTDPDASARALRARLGELCGTRPALLLTDSFGRAWRRGQAEVAIGCAGLAPLDDWRGRSDAGGRELQATLIAVADQAAAAADLVRAKDGREPAVHLRGLQRHVTDEDGPGARALLRSRAEDLFR